MASSFTGKQHVKLAVATAMQSLISRQWMRIQQQLRKNPGSTVCITNIRI